MKLQRILSLALVFLLLAAPSGLAAETYSSILLSNFHFELGSAKPQDVDATLKAGYGGSLMDGSARLDIQVTGDGRTAFSGTASVDDEKLRAVLEKSSYRFEIPLERLEKLFFSSDRYQAMYPLWYMLPYQYSYYLYDFMDFYSYGYGSSKDDGPSPEDFQKAGDLIERYADYARKTFTLEDSKERDRKLFEVLKPEAKGQEDVTLFGQQLSLYRYEITFSEEELRDYYEAVYEADPELKALEEDLMALMKDFGLDEEDQEDEKDEDEKGEEDGDSEEEPQDFLDQMLEDSGIEGVSYVVWSDTEVIGDKSSRAQKSEMTFKVKDAVDEYGMPVDFSFPLSFSSLETEEGLRVNADIAYAPYEGESATVVLSGTLDMPQRGGGTRSNLLFKLDMSSADDGIELSTRMTASESIDADGVGDTAVSLKGTANGEDFELTYAYDGEVSTPEKKSGTISVSYDLPSGSTSEGKSSKGSFRFDTLIETVPYEPADYAAYESLQPVNPLDASRNVMDKVSSDLYGAVMQGVGVLMQTHGLSMIIGGLMNAA